VVGVETQRLRKDGAAVDVELFAAPLLDDRGEYDGYIGIVGDITERKAAERALRASEERYRELFENARDLLVTTALDGTITSVNRAAEELSGASRDELVGRHVTALFTPESAERSAQYLERLIAGSEETTLEELELAVADGTTRTIEAGARVIRGRDGAPVGFQCIGRDVSERLRLEAHLRQAQKMEAVGRLAGGIAHDFNNLLTAISGFSDFALGTLEDEHPVREDIVEIQRAVERAATLTGQLLAFSRRQVQRRKVLDLADAVGDLEPMLARLIGEDVALVSVHEDGLGAVEADPGQVEQVILNLALNARDAMPRGGTVTLETANVVVGDDHCRRHVGARPGPHVTLSVSDTGEGIDADTLQHVFEPFFTTKEQGKGTGLGLATVYGIVEQSGGWVEVESEPGRGTSFRIYLPCVDGAPAAEIRDADALASGGSETVLVVEDEPMVRSLARRALAERGYRVLEAEDGESALRISRRHAGPIHLLLSDVVMPGMSGADLSERFARVRPETAALFMSGYTAEALGPHGVLADGVDFIAKPFTPDALAARVRAALDARRDADDGAPAAAAA
jgi:PAS domain S-box-containing protein